MNNSELEYTKEETTEKETEKEEVTEETETSEEEKTESFEEKDPEETKKHERLYKIIRFAAVFVFLGAIFVVMVYSSSFSESLRTTCAYVYYALALALFISYIILNRGLFTGDLTKEYLDSLDEEKRKKALEKQEKTNRIKSNILVFLYPITVIILLDALFQLILKNYQ